MDNRRMGLAMMAAAVGLSLGAAGPAGAAPRWTLATDDTTLTLGMDDQGHVAIFQLKHSAQEHNWMQGPSLIPMPELMCFERIGP